MAILHTHRKRHRERERGEIDRLRRRREDCIPILLVDEMMFFFLFTIFLGILIHCESLRTETREAAGNRDPPVESSSDKRFPGVHTPGFPPPFPPPLSGWGVLDVVREEEVFGEKGFFSPVSSLPVIFSLQAGKNIRLSSSSVESFSSIANNRSSERDA